MRVQVAPVMLEWACRRGGLDEQTLLRDFPKLPQWKVQEVQPTLKQLEKFAQKNHVPLGMLFLPSPPVETVPIPDFRTIQSAELLEPSRDLLKTIYHCQRQQDWYAQYLRDSGFEENSFVGSLTVESDVIDAAECIRIALGFDGGSRQGLKTWEETLRFLVDQVGSLNILVMVNGIVAGNTHRALDPDEFRGFALVDPVAPLIFINGADTKAAQIFTLAHELAHVWLGRGGISNLQVIDINGHQQQIESWCNQVAAELLVPLDHLGTEFNINAHFSDELNRLAKVYKVSSLVILRRLYDLGIYGYPELKKRYQNELDQLREKMSANQKSGGGDFYRTLGVRENQYFIRAVVSSALEGKTLFRDAFRLLSLKNADTFFKLAKQLGAN
ncbi:ImmA/IrrE family metallo-endopeptidase [Synechocystis salina LEGE 06155]|nr:ImmA/IrrE family metallo-endopeptidase [Synechocystis salina LEGE 06155]